MTIHLPSFTTTLDPTLIEKGKNWFSLGMVQQVQHESPCVWKAALIGPTKQFKVTVEIVGKDVVSFFCPCSPRLCSHVVALLFELVEKEYPTEQYYPERPKSEQPSYPERAPGDKQVYVKQTAVRKLLQNIDGEKLKTFVENYSQKDKSFRDLFLVEFGEVDLDGRVKRFKSIINSTLDHDEFREAKRGTVSVLKDAQTYLKDGQYDIAFAACKAVLVEMAPFACSSYEPGNDAIEEALVTLRELTLRKDLPDRLRSIIFHFIFQEYKNPAYKDFHFIDPWPDIFIATAQPISKLQQVASFIEEELKTIDFFYHSQCLLGHQEKIEDALQ